jgi:hypothetical protein
MSQMSGFCDDCHETLVPLTDLNHLTVLISIDRLAFGVLTNHMLVFCSLSGISKRFDWLRIHK